MSKSLLIWENVSESIDFYLIPDDEMKLEWLEQLNEAHGHYLNSTDDDVAIEALNWICDELYNDAKLEKDKMGWFVRNEDNNTEPGVLSKFKIEMKQPLMNENISRVFYMGLVM